jgi:hypothetical protein
LISAIVLSGLLAYFQAPPVRALSPAQAQKLYDVRVRFGDGGHGPTYVKRGRPNRRVATCRQYETAQLDGFEPATNFDIAMSGFLVRACGLLDAAAKAQPARRSFVDAPRVGVRDIDQISLAALPREPSGPARLTTAEEQRRERTSIGAYARANHCRVTVATANELQLRCGDWLYALTELFRADIDGDGVASIVVAPYLRSMTGTLVDPEPVIGLSRTSRSALLVPAAITPLAQSGE